MIEDVEFKEIEVKEPKILKSPTSQQYLEMTECCVKEIQKSRQLMTPSTVYAKVMAKHLNHFAISYWIESRKKTKHGTDPNVTNSLRDHPGVTAMYDKSGRVEFYVSNEFKRMSKEEIQDE